MPNVHGRSGSIEGKHLQLPFHWNGCGPIALGFVASLIIQLSSDRERFPILSERSGKLHAGVHLYILADSESSLEDRYSLIDHRQEERFGLRVQRWLQLHFRYRVDHQRYRLITLSARCIHVHIRRQPHFGSYRDASPGNAGAIGLLEGDLEVRGFDCFAHFLAQFREKFGNDTVSRKPLAVFRFEEFFLNDAFRVDVEIARARKALLHPSCLLIEDAICLDDPGFGVSEQRVLNLVPLRKELQDFFRVVADSRQLDPLLFESWNCTLQLDQLPFAKRSPVCGAEKEEDGSARALQRIESLCPAKLIANGESRSLLPNRESDGHQLDRSPLYGIAIERSPDGHRIAQVRGDLLLRVKAVHDPARVVIERQLGTGHVPSALRRFIERFVGVAGAGHKHPGPRPGFSHSSLLSKGEG